MCAAWTLRSYSPSHEKEYDVSHTAHKPGVRPDLTYSLLGGTQPTKHEAVCNSRDQGRPGSYFAMGLKEL